MNLPHFDVIVVGLGAMGSAACFHLASRGMRVLGLEQFDIPNTLGSSHGFSRMTRMAYYEHPNYVPLLKSSFQLWHDLESQAGRKLIFVTGGLYMGPTDGELVGGSLRSARQHGLDHELLDHAALARRFGQFHLPENFSALLEHDAGFILPESAIAAHANLALRRGAELHGQEAVADFRADSTGVTVATTRSTYTADKLIFTAGAWTDRLVRDLGIPFRVTRQTVAWVWPKQPELFELGRLPVWAVDRLDGTIHYGIPITFDCPGFKLAHHGPATIVDPDIVSRKATDNDEQLIRPFLRETIPAADGPLLSMRVCLYTNSPDHHFIIDRHPVHDRVLLACGFSGHGFKFAPVIGQILADLAIHGTTPHPIGIFRISRLAGPAIR